MLFPLATKDARTCWYSSNDMEYYNKMKKYASKYTYKELRDKEKWGEEAEEQFKREQIINHKI